MRTIKFRAWHIKEKRMIPFAGASLMGNRKLAKMALERVNGSQVLECMQFTGLLDKNGKEIYEGDIVQRDGEEWKDEVVWLMGSFRLKEGGEYLGDVIADIPKELEVIGNKFEDKKLK